MTFEQIWQSHLSDLTVNQFMSFLMAFLLLGLIGLSLCELFKFILNLITYFIHNDKYNFDFPFYMRILRYIGRLRKQVMNAPTEKAYYLYYNQLIGAVHFGSEMGYFSDKNVLRFLDVKSNYWNNHKTGDSD